MFFQQIFKHLLNLAVSLQLLSTFPGFATCHLPPITCTCHLLTVTCHLPPAAYHLPSANCHLPPVTCLRQTTICYLPPATYHLPRATCYLVPTTFRLIPATGYLLPVTCHLLYATCHLPLATCHLPPTTSHLSFFCTLRTASLSQTAWLSKSCVSVHYPFFPRMKIHSSLMLSTETLSKRISWNSTIYKQVSPSSVQKTHTTDMTLFCSDMKGEWNAICDLSFTLFRNEDQIFKDSVFFG